MTKRVAEEDVYVVLEIHFSCFVIFEIPPRVHEMVTTNTTIIDFIEKNIVTDDVRIKTSANPSSILRFEEKFCFNKLLALALNWDYFPNQVNIIKQNHISNRRSLFELQSNWWFFINRKREPKLLCCTLNKPLDIKDVFEPEIIPFGKTTKSFWCIFYSTWKMIIDTVLILMVKSWPIL